MKFIKANNSTLLMVIIILITFAYLYLISKIKPTESIKVGILHSLSGSLAISEEPVMESTLLAIEEINKAGGLLGKPIEAIVLDGKSDEIIFEKQAERLIKDEKVVAIFGCWTSASRKRVKNVVEKYNNLLFYPVQYEGLEESANIIYTGATPNQQIIPGVIWALNHLGKKFFLVGSDYIFSRVANEIIKEVLINLGGSVVGEEYIHLNSNNFENTIKNIEEKQPDVILNTLNGNSNNAFFHGIKNLENINNTNNINKKQSIMSFSVTDSEFTYIGIENIIGTYTCWNYFESIDTQENQEFVKKIKNKYGYNQIVNDPMEAAYFGVHLWANAIKQAKSTDKNKLIPELYNLIYQAPEGIVSIEKTNNNTWKTVRIGKVNEQGKSEIIFESDKPLKPKIYPNETTLFHYFKNFRSTDQWKDYINMLFKKWGNRWSA